MSREVRLSDRVKQLSFDPSTNAFSLDSIATGFSPFRDFYEDGDVVFYAATDGTRYEVGSGEYNSDTLTRYPLRSSNISSGPYFVNDASAHGSTRGKEGHFYPLYLTKSAASGIKGFAGVANSVHEHQFSGFPGVTFYMPDTHAGHAVTSYHPAVSGENYAVSGGAIDFQGVTEVFVTYPGKTSVFTGAGVSGFSEPRKAGVAFWGNEQTLDYDSDIVWSTGVNGLGISQPSPKYAIDVGNEPSYSIVRASGFIGGGSGVQFSGGQALPQSALKTASGGRQLEPFFRSELDNQTKTDQVFSLSGLVDQRLLFEKQMKGQIFAGPPSGCAAVGCDPDFPEFRYLELEDVPDLSSLYVVQQNHVDYSYNIPEGAVAFTTASGKIEFDSGVRYDKNNNYLGVGINKPPVRTLDVGGDAGISGQLMVSGDAQFGGDIYAAGDLIVSGTRTYLDSTVVTLKDINLELASQSGDAINSDSAIDDAGIIVKSTNYDKKWTWRDSTDAWTTTEKIDVSGIIFNDGSMISGAYQPGSGLELHNEIVLNVGNLFQVSGEDGTNGFIHQGSIFVVSGVSGIDTTYTQLDNSGRLTIDPTFLKNNVYDKIDSSGNNLLTTINSSGNNLLATINSSGNSVRDFAITSGQRAVQVASGYAQYYSDVSGQSLQTQIDGLGGGYSEWIVDAVTSAGAGVTDSITAGQTVNFRGSKGIVPEYADGSNTLTMNAAGLSGWADTNTSVTSGNLTYGMDVSGQMLKAAIDAGGFDFDPGSGWVTTHVSVTSGNLTYGMDVSGQAQQGVIDASGNTLKDLIDAIDSPTNVSGWVDTHVSVTSGNLTYGMDVSGQVMENLLINSGQRAVQVASGYAQYYSDVSGVSLSGYVDGVAGIASAASPSYGSGLINQNGTIDFRHNGSGTLEHLRFHGPVRVGDGASTDSVNLETPESGNVFIGRLAGSGSLNEFDTSGVFIGYKAGALSSGQQNSVYIGPYAGHRSDYFNGVAQSQDNVGLGRNAGRANLNVDDSIFIGKNAGIHSSGMFGLQAIGEGAARNIEGGQDVVAIGTLAAGDTSGIYRSVAIGRGALSGVTDFSNTNAIGYRAGALSTSVNGSYSNFIGDIAGLGSWKNENVNFIGRQAGFHASGCVDSNFMGYDAGDGANVCNKSNFIGYKTGLGASGVHGCNVLGYSAGSGSRSCIYNDTLGVLAAQNQYDVNYSLFIGASAGSSASQCDFVISEGYGNFLGASGANNVVSVGYGSFKYSHDASNTIGIGTSVGHQSSGVINSVLIGRNVMAHLDSFLATETTTNTIAIGDSIGYLHASRRLGDYNLIIEPNESTRSRHKVWCSDYADHIISIGSIIHGFSSAMSLADGSCSRHLQIGKQPDSIGNLQESVLTLRPDNATDVLLHLKANESQASPLLRAETSNTSSGGVVRRINNTIVNKEGFLQIPIGTSYSSNKLYDSDGNKISSIEGTLAVWKNSNGHYRWIIFLNNKWRYTSDWLWSHL